MSLDQAPHAAAGAAPDLDVGDRLRALRRSFGLSQRELAKRSGVTNATISLVEQNRVSPSIASLKKLLAGFPISLAEFFSEGPAVPDKIFYRAHELVEIGTETVSFRQIGERSADRSLQVLHERYQPGADTGESMLSHEGEEAGIVIRGEIDVTVGTATQRLRPGDGYYFRSRIPHRFHNPRPEPCEIVSVCTPPTF